VVERLPRKYEVLNSIPITATQTKKKRKERRREGDWNWILELTGDCPQFFAWGEGLGAASGEGETKALLSKTRAICSLFPALEHWKELLPCCQPYPARISSFTQVGGSTRRMIDWKEATCDWSQNLRTIPCLGAPDRLSV
jgi:hypothetical protein